MVVKNIFMKMLKVMVMIGLIVSNIRLIYYIDSTIDPLMTYEYSDPVICSVICIFACELSSCIAYVLFAKVS